MLSLTIEKIEQARRDMRKRKDTRNAYVKNWRQKQRVVKRKTIFVHEYVRAKFDKVYAEAMKFYSQLDQTYPDKKDLCRTTEFRKWRENVTKKSTAPTQQSAHEATAPTQQSAHEATLVLNIPLLSHPPSTVETTSTASELAPSEIQQSASTPPEIGAETIVEMPPPTPLETDDEINDRRIQEILAELRDDPDLNRIFGNVEPNDQIDEGVELPTLEQEIHTDIGLIDNEDGFSVWL